MFILNDEVDDDKDRVANDLPTEDVVDEDGEAGGDIDETQNSKRNSRVFQIGRFDSISLADQEDTVANTCNSLPNNNRNSRVFKISYEDIKNASVNQKQAQSFKYVNIDDDFEIDIGQIGGQDDKNRSIFFNKEVLVFLFSGIFSSVTYELMLKADHSISLVSSFFLHLYIILFSLPKAYLYLMSSKIPMSRHVMIVSLSFLFIYFKSLAIPILPMPVFIICTNLQLVVGSAVGRFIFKKTFIPLQYVGVLLISLGCLIITMVSSKEREQDGVEYNIPLGLVYMLLSIVSLSIMIPLGSTFVQQYNADVDEQIFVQHFLALPLFLMNWNTKILPVIKKLLFVENLLNTDEGGMANYCCYKYNVTVLLFGWIKKMLYTVDDQQDLLFDCDESSCCSATSPYHNNITLSMYGYNISILIPTLLIYLILTTVFAQINRHYMMEVSIKSTSWMAQLVGSSTKTIVFMISALYFNAPPYPHYGVWVGLCTQVVGSYVYVKASFSRSKDVGKKDIDKKEVSFNFTPNTSTSRLDRVSWRGDRIYDCRLLGLSNKDVEFIRQATSKHNNRVSIVECEGSPDQEADDLPGLSASVVRTVSDVTIPVTTNEDFDDDLAKNVDAMAPPIKERAISEEL